VLQFGPISRHPALNVRLIVRHLSGLEPPQNAAWAMGNRTTASLFFSTMAQQLNLRNNFRICYGNLGKNYSQAEPPETESSWVQTAETSMFTGRGWSKPHFST